MQRIEDKYRKWEFTDNKKYYINEPGIKHHKKYADKTACMDGIDQLCKEETPNDLVRLYSAVYELTQIRAYRDIPEIGLKKGDLGGWILTGRQYPEETEFSKTNDPDKALSHFQSCWIDKDSELWSGYIAGDAQVVGSIITENSTIDEHAIVKNSWIANRSSIQHRAKIENSKISNSDIYGYARISDSKIYSTTVCHSAKIKRSEIYNITEIKEDTRIIDTTMTNPDHSNDVRILRGGVWKNNKQIEPPRSPEKEDANYSRITIAMKKEDRDALFGLAEKQLHTIPYLTDLLSVSYTERKEDTLLLKWDKVIWNQNFSEIKAVMKYIKKLDHVFFTRTDLKNNILEQTKKGIFDKTKEEKPEKIKPTLKPKRKKAPQSNEMER